MAFVGIKVPPDVAEKLSMVDVPGERSEPGEMHITLLYLGKTASIAQVIRAVAVLAAMAQRTKPFLIGCAVRTCFPENPDDGVPVIARIQSPTIAKFQAELTKQMEKAGVEYSKKYPDFKPHVTLAYADEQYENLEFEPIVWTVGAVTVWGGEGMDDKIVASVALEG